MISRLTEYSVDGGRSSAVLWPMSRQQAYSSQSQAVALNHVGGRPHLSTPVLPFASTTEESMGCYSFTNPRGIEGWVDWRSCGCFNVNVNLYSALLHSASNALNAPHTAFHKLVTHLTTSLAQKTERSPVKTSILTNVLGHHTSIHIQHKTATSNLSRVGKQIC